MEGGSRRRHAGKWRVLLRFFDMVTVMMMLMMMMMMVMMSLKKEPTSNGSAPSWPSHLPKQ